MDKTNQHKKALIMTVGTGTTGSDIAHGLFFSIKDSNPDLLVLIGSQKSFDTTLNHLMELIKKESIDCEIIEKVIAEINDFEKLHFEYTNIIEELLKKGFTLNKIAVDYTSGTKSMSAALVSAAISKRIGSILYVYGERGEGGRVKSGTERRSSLSPNKIFSLEILNKAIDYFNLYRFSTCLDLLNNYEFHPDYKDKVNILIKLSNVFDAWDKFNFSDAFNQLKSLPDDKLQEVRLKGKFDSLFRPLLAELKKSELNYEKVDDIIFNSERRASEGKYDDAVARLYRALEMLGQIEFEKEFKCKTEDVILENLPDSVRESVKFKYQSHINKKIQLPMFKTFDVLLAVKNPAAIIFEQNNTKIKEHINKRNNSILAHGSVPVEKERFEDFFNFLTSKFNLGPKSDRYSAFSFPCLTYKI